MGYYVGGDVLGASLTQNALVGAGANLIVPGSGAAVTGALSLFGSLFGGGAAEDQRRMARVAYFYNLAAAGNVGAAQVMLGAIPDVSGNEQPYWQHALTQLQTANPAVYAAAAAAGPQRFTGTGDTPENYPHMQAFALNWAATHAPVSSSSSTPAYTPSAGGVPVSSQMLPVMTSRAPYNWTPVLVGVGALTFGALVLPTLSRRGRRR